MINTLAKALSSGLVSNNIISNEKRKYYVYGIELLLNDLLIFLMIAAIAIITNTIFPTFIFICIFCVLRGYTGGYHSNSYLGCFLTTILNYSFMLLYLFFMDKWVIPVSIVMMVLSVPVMIRYSPLEHANKSLDYSEKKKYNKIATCIIMVDILFFIMSIRLVWIQITAVISWAMFATAILMLLAMIQQKKEETK